MSLLIVGGCHVSGYNVPPRRSFAELLGAYLHTRSRRLAPVPLKKHALISEALLADHSDIVVLQLGNYEFHGSYKRLFKKHFRLKPGHTEGNPETDDMKAIVSVPEEALLKKGIRYALLPFFILYLIVRNRRFLNDIRSCVHLNQRSRFIILTPIPCLTFADNITRKIAGRYFKRKFSGISNVTFIDLYEPGKTFYQDSYSDPAHLNEKGHQELFEYIAAQL